MKVEATNTMVDNIKNGALQVGREAAEILGEAATAHSIYDYITHNFGMSYTHESSTAANRYRETKGLTPLDFSLLIKR